MLYFGLYIILQPTAVYRMPLLLSCGGNLLLIQSMWNTQLWKRQAFVTVQDFNITILRLRRKLASVCFFFSYPAQFSATHLKQRKSHSTTRKQRKQLHQHCWILCPRCYQPEPQFGYCEQNSHLDGKLVQNSSSVELWCIEPSRVPVTRKNSACWDGLQSNFFRL